MRLYSTNRKVEEVSFEEALFKGLPADNGLYMPTIIPKLPDDFFQNLPSMSYTDMAFEVSKALLSDEIPEDDLKTIVDDAFTFPAPVKNIHDNVNVLELFHGPSLAFKDFGARFMAKSMAYFLNKKNREITILVATSGDTGSAVAQGFYDTPGVNVVILYPSGKVSLNQEKQLTTLGKNITALEIDGVFDDCQRLVKTAFLDKELGEKINLSSANSINIARLIPQAMYYFNAYSQIAEYQEEVLFCVPSGNFGNLCGGLIASKMGLPVKHFIAATNINKVVPDYLESGNFKPKDSIATISNAMDVGNPSNFPRMLALYDNDYDALIQKVSGKFYNDEQTRKAIKTGYYEHHYIMCPHTAVAYLGLTEFMQEEKLEHLKGILLATAHPSKFTDIVEDEINVDVEMPERLKSIISKEKSSIKMSSEFNDLKEFLLERF